MKKFAALFLALAFVACQTADYAEKDDKERGLIAEKAMVVSALGEK